MIIDVRSPASFEKETIPGSINIPLAELEGYLKKMSTDTFILVHGSKNQPCQPGVDRSVNRYAEIYDRRPDSIDRNFLSPNLAYFASLRE
jgi:Rhodanese-like domain